MIVSCKQDGSQNASQPIVAQTQAPTTKINADNSLFDIVKNTGKNSPETIKNLKTAAVAILDHRQKENNKKAFILLDKDMFEFEFVFTGKTMTKPGQLSGSWIDFNEDLTYTYGYYQEDQGAGRYTYDLDSGLLLIVDDNDAVKPQEFEAKLFDRSLIMDGNEVYKDNNFNAKLRRITEKPIKIN